MKFFSVFLCQRCREIWREILVKFSVLRFPEFGCARENFTKISRQKRCEKRKISGKFHSAGAQRWLYLHTPRQPAPLRRRNPNGYFGILFGSALCPPPQTTPEQNSGARMSRMITKNFWKFRPSHSYLVLRHPQKTLYHRTTPRGTLRARGHWRNFREKLQDEVLQGWPSPILRRLGARNFDPSFCNLCGHLQRCQMPDIENSQKGCRVGSR